MNPINAFRMILPLLLSGILYASESEHSNHSMLQPEHSPKQVYVIEFNEPSLAGEYVQFHRELKAERGSQLKSAGLVDEPHLAVAVDDDVARVAVCIGDQVIEDVHVLNLTLEADRIRGFLASLPAVGVGLP